MASNSFGLIYRFTTFGESHGPAIGVVLDGVGAGHQLDLQKIQIWLNRRRPNQSSLTSRRREKDLLKLQSGVFEGKTTGSPICFLLDNEDADPEVYEAWKEVFRPGHADYSWFQKYGHLDHRGGGRSSARETAGRVIAGAVAMQFLEPLGISISSKIIQAGQASESEEAIENEILKAKQAGDSTGARVEIKVQGIAAGIGEPVYEKLDARLAYALMGINAVKSVEIGDGVLVCQKRGSENNDQIRKEGFLSNHAGGILGGVSTGQDILIYLGFKPSPSIFVPQKTINRLGQDVELVLRGRHDPCVAVRGRVVAEAMVAQVLWDLILLGRHSRTGEGL